MSSIEKHTVKFSSLFNDWKQFLNIPNGIAPLDNQRKLPLENLPSEYLEIIPKANNNYLGLVRPDNVTIQVDENGMLSVNAQTHSVLIPDSIHFNNVVGKPNSLLLYGIEDAYTKTEIDSLFPSFNNFYRKNEIDARIPTLDYYYSRTQIDEKFLFINDNYPSNDYLTSNYYDKEYIDNVSFSTATINSLGLVKPDNVTTKVDEHGVISVTGSALTTDSVHWNNVTSKPTTVYGFGIVDAYTKTEIDFLLPKYNIGDYYTKVEVNEFFLSKETFLAEFPTIAKSDNLGLVMPDGVTLQVDHNGILSVLNNSTGLTPDAIHWNKIVAKPNTLDGYNLTNVYTKEETDNIFSTKAESAVQPAGSNILGIVKPDNQTIIVSDYGTLSVIGQAATNPIGVEFKEGPGIKIDAYTISVNFGKNYNQVARGDHTHNLNDLNFNYIKPTKLGKNYPTSNSFLRGDGYWYEIKANYTNGPGLILDNNSKFSVDFGLNNNQVARGDHTHNINNLDGQLDISYFGDNSPSNTSYLRGDNTWVDVNDIVNDSNISKLNISSKLEDFTALRFYTYFVNTTDNSINVTLPNSPEDGDWFVIVDLKNNFSENNVIIKYDNTNIDDVNGDYVLDGTNNYSNQIKFVFFENNWFILV